MTEANSAAFDDIESERSSLFDGEEENDMEREPDYHVDAAGHLAATGVLPPPSFHPEEDAEHHGHQAQGAQQVINQVQLDEKAAASAKSGVGQHNSVSSEKEAGPMAAAVAAAQPQRRTASSRKHIGTARSAAASAPAAAEPSNKKKRSTKEKSTMRRFSASQPFFPKSDRVAAE